MEASQSIFQFKRKVEFDHQRNTSEGVTSELVLDDTNSELGYQHFLKISNKMPTTSTEQLSDDSEMTELHTENYSDQTNVIKELEKQNERLKKLELQNELIIKNQRTIMRKLIVIRSNSNRAKLSTEDTNEESLSELNIPANSVAEFQNLEAKCKDDLKIEKYLEKIFSNVAVNDLSKYISMCLLKVITDEAATKFSWFGLQNNISIKKFLIVKLLKDSAGKKFPSASEMDVNSHIKKWFQRAKDRVRKQQNQASRHD